MTLLEFIKQYYDKPNTGDTPQNLGQCVGLIEVWIDALSLPHVWGNAKDLLDNADPNSYDIIHNTPDNVPSIGDVFVFGETYGGGVGHTGIVIVADTNLVSLFEQNDGINGGTPQLKTYTYDGALGWLHPKGVVVDQQSLIDSLRNQRDANWNLYQGELQKNSVLQNQLTQCQQAKPVEQPTPSQAVSSTSTSSPVENTSTTTIPVPITTTGTNMPPVQPKPIPIPSPIKPPMDWYSRIVFILLSIKNVLKKYFK